MPLPTFPAASPWFPKVIPNLRLYQDVGLDPSLENTRIIPSFQDPTSLSALECGAGSLKDTRVIPHLHPGQSWAFTPGDPQTPPAPGCGAGSIFGGDQDNPFIPGDPKPLPALGLVLDPSLKDTKTIPHLHPGQPRAFTPGDSKSLPALECGAGSIIGGHQDNPFIPGDPKYPPALEFVAGSIIGGHQDNLFIPSVPKSLPEPGCGAGSILEGHQGNPTPPSWTIPGLHSR
ncbi:hypothetical protein HGM15179_001876 [Zosterops borbonicus]|uniref:Uncharacterized protein n=1 Tax=Zosterops borbonicus TaxID=364589 RepID=A0A8K1LSI2_9PASS|nr:hypothetical protein HGM15179_001876 [Zosterops borbonicus]